MAQTFDIRFARSAGLAALLEVPLNRFRWKGGGRLQIDAKGMSIGVKRGLLALFGAKHTQHISNENLRSVYREGEALRVEFENEESTRVVLPFWAGDRDTAAQIVRLLPTSQTVEIEHSTDATHSGKSGTDPRVLLTLGIVLAAGVAATLAVVSDKASPLPIVNAQPAEASTSQDAAAPSDEPTATPPGTDVAPPSDAAMSPSVVAAAPVVMVDRVPQVRFRGVEVVPIARGTMSHDVAVRELAVFERETALLEFDYREAHKLLVSGGISRDVFAEILESLEMRWWDVTFHIYDSPQLEDPALLDFRRVMLGAARRWRNYLGEYATRVRGSGQVLIAGPLAEVARAQEMRARARSYVR